MKRFYDTVAVRDEDGAFQVMLDGRGLKTVRGAPQLLPTRALADALASEWAAQGEELDPASFPMRDMADYAIDVVMGTREGVAEKLLAYLDTDTLCYRADPDDDLYSCQQKMWEPILTAFEQREGVSLARISGIIHRPQSPDALNSLRNRLTRLSAFNLAGIEAATSLAASLVCSLSAVEPGVDPLTIWQAAGLEEDWQADQWGRDSEAEDRRLRRQADFLRACEFVRLCQS